jgi:hypothetical protein
MGSLTLNEEVKIHRLMPDCDEDCRLEASGVLVHDEDFIVVFDNLSRIARIGRALSRDGDNQWTGDHDDADSFEDLTYSPRQQRFYVLIEARPHEGDTFRADAIVYNRRFNELERHRLPFNLESENKGFEGWPTSSGTAATTSSPSAKGTRARQATRAERRATAASRSSAKNRRDGRTPARSTSRQPCSSSTMPVWTSATDALPCFPRNARGSGSAPFWTPPGTSPTRASPSSYPATRTET